MFLFDWIRSLLAYFGLWLLHTSWTNQKKLLRMEAVQVGPAVESHCTIFNERAEVCNPANGSTSAVITKEGFKKNDKLLIIGLDNAGKSTLLTMLSDGRVVQHAQTPRGPCQELDMGTIRFTAYNLGGHPKIRRVWKDYYPAVDGIIFMVDCADPTRFEEARDVIDRTIHDDVLSDVPIAILFNKTDRKEAVGEEYLVDKMKLGKHRTGKKHTPRPELTDRPLETFPCSILKRTGYGDALRWLAYYIEQL